LSIAPNQYFIGTPASNFKSKVEAQLAGVDYFFYITDSGDLVVKTFSGVVSYTLAAGAKWVDIIPEAERLHVYWSDKTSNVMHLVFEQFGGGSLVPVATGINSANLTFSVNYAAHSTPPVYVMLVDTGFEHILYVAQDPDFHTLLAPATRVYSNLVDPAYFVTRPMIAIHPLDTNVATVNVQRLKVSNNESKVGFYVITLPGVV
jgi:hypothetical protein